MYFFSWHCGGEYCLQGFSAAPTEVIAAAKIAEAHEFYHATPQGYETIVESAVRNIW